jgi:Ser/Thr protein kinase RdoA (MazF antagonist)
MDKAAAIEAYALPAREALREFPIDVDTLELVSVSENVCFRVTDRGDGAAYVLRLHRPWYHTLEELNAERMWIRALGEAGVNVPVPLTTRDGREYTTVPVPVTDERRNAGVARWTEGELLALLLHHNNDVSVFENYFAQLGAIVAAMHNQASGWQVPAAFTRHRLDTDGLMGDTPFWGPFWEHPALSSAERQLMIGTRDELRAALDRYGRPSTTFSLIHADMHPGNLLVHDDSLTVIDFDDAGFGWHQYDIAVALRHYMDEPYFGAIQAAFVRGYRAVREIADAALALVPMFMLIRGLASIGWIAQRPELSRDLDAEYKDAVCAQCRAFEPPC